MKIAVDAMGGDYAPEEIVLGAVEAVKAYDFDVVLVGDEKKIRGVLSKYGAKESDRLSIVHASEVIEMGEHPAQAIRRKKDASIVVATRLVKDGLCDAVVAAGSTGAAVTAALFGLGRIKGIERPCPVEEGHYGAPRLRGQCQQQAEAPRRRGHHGIPLCKIHPGRRKADGRPAEHRRGSVEGQRTLPKDVSYAGKFENYLFLW